MQMKHWMVLLVVLALVVAGGTMVLAGNDTADVTIYVKWLDGSPVQGADVTVYESGEDMGPVVAGPEETDLDGKAQFQLAWGQHYEAEALINLEGWQNQAHSHFYLPANEDTWEVTIYMYHENETDIFYAAGGPIGVSLHLQHGHHHNIPMGETLSGTSTLEVEVHNTPDNDPVDVDIEVEAMPGDGWDGRLVDQDPAEGQIAIRYSEGGQPFDWIENATLTLDEGEDWRKAFDVKAQIGEDTQDIHGRIIFRALLSSD